MTHPKTHRIFALLLGSTGLFALVSALYTWGDGPLWEQTELTHVLIPWGDLLLAGPTGMAAGYGLWTGKRWGRAMAMFAAGIFVFGSILVGVMVVWHGPPYPWKLLLPGATGMAIGIAYAVWNIRKLVMRDG